MANETRGFTGGMDYDTDEALLSSDKYRYALNIRNGNSERGAVGAITNAEGNTLVSVTLPSGANRVLGCLDDEANDRVIYIVYNSGGNNRILAYDYKNTVVKTILTDSGNILGLSSDYLITAINVIIGESTSYLLFTDNFGEPKNINIEQGIRTYDTNIDGSSEYIYRRLLGDFDVVAPTSVKTNYVYSRDIVYTDEDGSSQNVTYYYRATAFTAQDPTSSTADPNPQSDWEFCPAGYIYGSLVEESYTAIVKPPSLPEANYTTNENDYNYLYGNLYQVKTKYVLADGRESSWSDEPQFIDPNYVSDAFLNPTAYNPSSKYNNQITISVAVPDMTTYKSVDIAVRRQMNDRSPDDWQLAGRVNILDSISDTVYTDGLRVKFNFDGSNTPMPLDTDLAAQLMSWIPPKAKTQAVTARNRVLYANFTEGKPIDQTSQRGIAQNPPKVQFFERDNPYDTSTGLVIYDYNGTVVGSQITEESFFDPPIRSASGLAFAFPATVVVGRKYQINIRPSHDTGGLTEPVRGFGATVSRRPSSNSTAALLDSFVSAFNNNDKLYVFSYGGEDFDKYLITVASADSGGTKYLFVQPTAAATNGSVTITPQIKVVPATTIGSTTVQIPSFKRGTNQAFGVVYSDNYGRMSTVITHPQFSANNRWWKDLSVSAAGSAIAGNAYSEIGQRYAHITLAHDAPSWATRYHIVKSLSNGILNSISFPLASVTGMPTMTTGEVNPLDGKYFFRGYVKSLVGTTSTAAATSAATLGGSEFLYLPLSSLQNSTVGYSNLSSTPIAYDYTQGDRLRICYSKAPATGAFYYEAEADAEILFYSSEINAVAIKVNALPDSLVGTGKIFAKPNEDGNAAPAGSTAIRGLLCEIYTPQKTKTEEFFYEMYTGTVSAETANSRYFHVANTQTQTSAQSAIVELANGDCFLKPRTYVWKANTLDVAVLANNEMATYFVEDSNYYDKIESKTWGAGRPNRVIKSTSQEEDIVGFLGEVKRPTTIRYTDPFDPAQGLNGLGTVRDLSFKDANPALKSIQHLHTEGSRAIIFHENAVGFAESDRAVVTTLDGSNMTIGANTPLSDVVYYADRAGIGTNPESFAFNNSRKYFVDVDQGQVCRLSQDGVTPISDAGMNKYFKSVFRSMINSPKTDFAYGAYDKRTDEYTVCLKWNVEVSGNSQTNAAATSSGALLTFTVGDTSGYDVYAGGNLRVFVPEQNSGATYYASIDTSFEVSAVTSTTIALNVPTINKYQINTQFNQGEPVPDFNAFIYPNASRTLTYSERLKAWTSFHSFNAENICSAGLDFVSFRAGKLYTHDDYANPHSYYGTDYPAYIDVVSNGGAPDQIKVWHNAALKLTTEDAQVVSTDFLIPVASADTTGAQEAMSGGVETSEGKYTTAQAPVEKENQLYFPYMRLGTGTAYSGFVQGDSVRGYWVRTRFKIISGVTKIYKILSSKFDFKGSQYTK